MANFLRLLLFLTILIVNINGFLDLDKQKEGTWNEKEFEEAYKFLLDYLPARDKIDPNVTYLYLVNNVALAVTARNEFQWAKDVPWEIFLNDVMPFGNLDEQRDPWRQLFYEKFKNLVKSAKTLNEAAQIMNKEIWGIWNIVFKSDQTPDIMSPFQTIEHHHASCTGLSIFLVDACRSVGIPARVAGAPCWNNGKDCASNNHDWVEIWDGGWSFTGGAEYNSQGLNKTWFVPSPAKYAIPGGNNIHALYAASFSKTKEATDYFPMAWSTDDKSIYGVDRTQVYLDLYEKEFEEAYKFLLDYLPARDKIDPNVTYLYLVNNVALAVTARNEFQWAKDVPWEIFLNDVMPFGNLDEQRDPWRQLFYEKFKNLVKSAKTLNEAAQILNKEIWGIWDIVFKPNLAPKIMSPFQTIDHHYASCTGLSIFLVDAFRSVGIPARVAGAPCWNDEKRCFPEDPESLAFNNHIWVEIWDGDWSFTGGAEYNSQGLNKTWFVPSPAKYAIPGENNIHALYAASFSKTKEATDYFPLIWSIEDKSIYGVDRTQVYLDLCTNMNNEESLL